VLARGRKAMNDKAYNLAAKLMSYVIAAEPGNAAATQLKADALRQMAQTTPTGIQTRNALLTEALHLEGKINRFAALPINFWGNPTPDNILRTEPGTYLKLLESYIDPVASARVQRIAKVTFKDLGRSWALHVRRGVAEVSETIPSKVDVVIELPRVAWAQIVIHQKTLADAIKAGEATINGDRQALEEILASFGGVSVARADPADLHPY
jgi:alkyl sulfatase BDS1-like metallo-beta-lactamase superfamily hydrolase